MDLIGKLKTTSTGNQYICVLIDYLTKWTQAYPLKTKCAEEVTQCILKFFYQFEAPKRILTDQGKEFVNEVSINNYLYRIFTVYVVHYISHWLIQFNLILPVTV